MTPTAAPIYYRHTGCTLCIGCGGGFDIYGALPLANLGSMRFANWSTSKDKFLARKSEHPRDYPESVLLTETSKVWSIRRNGVQLVKQALEQIMAEEGCDSILLVDGGVDSLMRGDEVDAGTYLEDFIMLAAVHQIKCNYKTLACIGFGTETEENLNHYRALENIAAFAADFLGTSSLIYDSHEFQFYKRVCERAWTQGRKSHIHTKVITAVSGGFGNVNNYDDVDPQLHGEVNQEAFVSPLSSIYWFFDADGVAEKNHMIPHLAKTSTFTDAMMVNRQIGIKKTRDKRVIPL